MSHRAGAGPCALYHGFSVSPSAASAAQDRFTALMVAADRGHVDSVAALIAAGADCNVHGNVRYATPPLRSGHDPDMDDTSGLWVYDSVSILMYSSSAACLFHL